MHHNADAITAPQASESPPVCVPTPDRKRVVLHPSGSGIDSLRRFALRACLKAQYGGERLQHAPFADSPKGCVLCLHAATRSHIGAGAEGVGRASSDYDEFLTCIGRQGTQRLLASVLQDHSDGFAQIGHAFLTRLALSVGPGHFRAIGDVPRPVPFDNRCEFVMHVISLARC